MQIKKHFLVWFIVSVITGIAVGCNGDAQTRSDITPLMWAVIGGDNQKVATLIAHGTDINLIDRDGNSALLFASGVHIDASEHQMRKLGTLKVSRQSVTIVRRLLANKANPNVQNHVGQTPLLAAVYQGWIDTAEALLESRADVNKQSKNGRTPLFYAANNCDAAMAKLLLRYGADPGFIDPTGESVMTVAKAVHCDDVEKLLEGLRKTGVRLDFPVFNGHLRLSSQNRRKSDGSSMPCAGSPGPVRLHQGTPERV